MKIAVAMLAVALGGCATTWQQSQDYVSRQSNWDVCRLTMGGPHSVMAQHEAGMRALNCAELYPAILARQAGQDAAVQNYINQINPPRQPQQVCTSQRVGDTFRTVCR